MNTAFDWMTMIIFAGLVTRFLHQSVTPSSREDRLVHYMVPSVGCAAANWLGNGGWPWPAAALIALTLGYIFYFLGPGAKKTGGH